MLTIKLIDQFRLCSGLRINYNKSEILPLGTVSNPPWTQNSIFSVAQSHITYLGIRIGKLPSSLYNLNYPPLLKKISQELANWMDLPLSLLGRCHLVKMVSFARLLYPLQTIPLLLQHKDTKILNEAISKFLWRNKRPRIAFTKLYLPRREGGISLPNVRIYNLACLLRISLDWVAQTSRYSNFYLETAMVYPYSLVALLHCKWKSIPPPLQHNLLLRDTAIAWREIRKSLKLSPFISRHLPIQGNPCFPPGLERQPYITWQQKGISNFASLCDSESGRPIPFKSLAETFQLPQSHIFQYGQCISFLKNACRDDHKRFKTSLSDSLLLKGSYKISDIYQPLLLKVIPSLETSSAANWAKDFPDADLVNKLLQGLNTVHKLVPNESWRETQLKIVHRAHIPFLSNKQAQTSSTCPLCLHPKPSLTHRFWSCTFISTFWDQVLRYIF